MFTFNDLQKILSRIDGRGYKAYKDLAGEFRHDQFTLFIDHVQGDPFAHPSRIRVRVPSAISKIPASLFANRIRRIALQDYLIRQIAQAISHTCRGHRGIGKSGMIGIDAGGQEVIERTAFLATDQWVEARMHVGLPADGRRVLGQHAEAMLCQELPQVVSMSVRWEALNQTECVRFVNCIENQEVIRRQLDSMGLVAFVADGSILPRGSGNSDRPMKKDLVKAFQSPPALRVSMPVLHETIQNQRSTQQLTGMGIPKGISLIVGGGYHGKSTLLRALQCGVYPHIPGDGREYVVTDPTATKIRAEDGRRIESVDISGFMTNLPTGQDTRCFSTNNASGSTSQAASILEAMEVHSHVLLMDEDTSATNFLIRDARMQKLVPKSHEPITPFIDRIRELYENFGISTVLVTGGSGDYFDVADTVIMMLEFQPIDVSHEARQIALAQPSRRLREIANPLLAPKDRNMRCGSLSVCKGKQRIKIEPLSSHLLKFGEEKLDLSGVEQLVDNSQVRVIGYGLLWLASHNQGRSLSVAEAVFHLDRLMTTNGLDWLDPLRQADHHPGNFARPRPEEMAAVINRLRQLHIWQD